MWFLSWRVMRDMCASCRILHNPIVFDTCYWWMRFHQPCWVAAHVWESMCMAHWQLGSYEILSRFYSVRVDSRSIRVTRRYFNQWAPGGYSYVGIPYSMWCLRTWIFEPSLVLSGNNLAYSSDWLSASRAILAGICFPPMPWPMTVCFRCFASKKPSEQEFFVPSVTDLAVKLLAVVISFYNKPS
jgi:hypothetical protein